MPKLAPTALILGSVALLAFAFILPSNISQLAAVGTTAVPSVSFTQEEVQGKEGSTIYLKVKLDQPVTRTTKVTIKLTPDQGTTSRDIPGLTGTKTVTFYAGGITTKTVAIRTSRTTAEGDKALTASITKVGNTTVQGDTARVLVKDQKSTGTILTGNNNTTATTTPPANCTQYEGVIPGETRRLSVQPSSMPSYVVNPAVGFALSPEAQAQLAQIQGDFGWLRFDQPDIELKAGFAYAYKFKTSEYNQTPGEAWLDILQGSTVSFSNPTSAIMMSFSECPGDFTSPQVLSQRINLGDRIPACVGYGRIGAGDHAGGTNLPVAIRGKQSSAGTLCLLDENKTYYMNLTAGFEYQDGREPASGTPFVGTYGNGTNPGKVISRRHITLGGYWQTGRSTFEFIKGKSAFYAEKKLLEAAAAAARKPAFN